MSIRRWAYERVSPLLPDYQVLSSGGAGAETPGDSPNRPFAMITFSDEIPALAPRYPTQQSRFAVWVHDEPGTMENIDSAIEILKNGLPGYALSAGGIYVAECWWETTSNDAYDDHYQTNTRYAEFLTTYRSN